MSSTEIVLEGIPKAVDASYYDNAQISQWYRLRPSEMGHECLRYIYLSFYWASEPQKPEGRIQRVFKRGLREEDRLLDDVRMAGITVVDKDASTGKQYTVEACDGHMFGFLDAAVIDTDGRHLPKQEWHVAECKTMSERAFRSLEKEGLAQSQPKHFAQMQIYMHITGMKAGLYAARNKNNEQDLFIRVTYDQSYAMRLMKKGDRIIGSSIAPERISEDPNFYICRICSQADVCFGKKKPLRNCRTCMFSQPTAGGTTYCNKLQTTMDKAQQLRGCERQRWKPSLINGTQVDTDGDFVRYKMKDGSTFTDSGA